MKTNLKLFLTCLGVMTMFLSNAQRGKEGNATITTTNNVVNTYTNVTAVTGATTLTVGNNAMNGGAFAGALAPGDLIMIIQMQGAVINCDTYPNDNGWGTYTIPAPYRWTSSWFDHAHEWGALIHLDIFANPTNGYGTAGKFEQVEVLSVTGGNTIEVICDLQNTYNTGSGHVQLVRIPRYDTLTVTNTASIVAGTWDGTTGGIVAVEVNSHLDVYAGGRISADEAGFRGGQLDNSGQSGTTAILTNVTFLGTSDPTEGSEKGEGIHGYTTELNAIASRYGISAASNGGGGGGFQNCGGGGGSNVYSGAIRYTGTGVPNPIYNVNWALDFSYPDLNGDPQTWSNLVGRPSPGGGRGGYALAEFDNNENTLGPRQAAWGGDGRKENGGRGGHPLVYDATRLYLGGGGGAGDQDSDQGGRGGTGGGIVYITTYGTFVGNGTVSANGEDGQKSNPLNQDPGASGIRKGNDGAGGGGAGGSIFIENAAAISSNILLEAEGGDGGDQDMRLFQAGAPFPVVTTDEASGPGGSGGGGNIAFNSGTPMQSVVAGDAGIITSQDFLNGVYSTNPGMVGNFPVNGATDGYVGELSLPAPYFDIVGLDTTICLGQVIDLTVSILGTYPTGTNATGITWYSQQFCDPTTNIVNTGLTYSAVSPAVTTTYYVGLCPSKFRIPVTVVVNSGATLVTTDPTALCAPATADISLAPITAGSDAGTLTYWTDNTMTTPIPDETAVGGGWHFIHLDIGGGCDALDSVFVTINPLDDASFTTSDFCASTVNTVSGVAVPGGTYVITGQTGSGLATINGGTGVLSNFVAGDQITIDYTTPAGGCQNTSTQVVNVLPADDPSFTTADFCASAVNVVSGIALPGGTFVITGQTGSGLVTINGVTGVLSNYVAGDQVTIQYTTPVGACQNSSSVVVNVTPADDASFTTSDFCVSSVNTISGVALPGGTYAITGQTGSGLATINGATGVLSNYVAGDQVTIEYTTPAGVCQNTSTQVVNVTPLDDASFTTVDFCESSVNTISGVALPGGTYAITGQTGSGLATINGTTGVLANFVAGDQVTIEYTTAAGGCQNASTQVVNILPADDASFTTADFCESSVNTISGVATAGGTYAITLQTGSGLVTINGVTGVLANYVAGDQVTIEYTTTGTCPNTSSQIVNVTALDDASFTTADFCESSVNAISGVATAGGTYAITGQTGSGLVTINGATGVLANYVAGDQVTIEYTTPAGGCQNASSQVVNVTSLDDASFTTADFCVSSVNAISGVVTAGGTYSITGQTGSGLATINGATGVLANYVAGDQVTIEYTTPAGGCQNASSQVVNVTPLDDASFTTVDFCISTVNTISGVAIPGGTYAITGQTGSGLATINGATGVLANYVAGDQVTIEYTTPAGGCQNTSTQVVNVTALDDASFTTADFCVSTSNTISAVATAGGTYVITVQTGSGLATINGATGVLTNYVAGDQVTIQYTTPAGACQSSSTQVVNVTPLDDASFTTADFCVSSVNTISAVTLPGGTYAITGQTGSGLATINGATGVLASYVAGDQVTIEYTTPAGGCQNTSTQVVNVTPLDDASFTTADFCVSSVNAISAVATPGGTYAITGQTGSGLATINGATGVLANYVAGDQVTIEYTTNGACPNTSTQVVNVTALDDASFTTADFCISTSNSISAVATAGGTYAITGQTGSGLATINGATGVLANFVAGDQVTIEYTTPAGGCQNTSTQVVNILPLDDATFVSSDFCVSAVNTISGVVTAGGTYAITSQTGSGLATINGATGVLANYVAGDQITIEYTTPAAGCQNTSTQVVNVTPLDDASFTTADFCEASVNVISGVAIPGGTYAISGQTGSGLATINGVTGVLANYVAGDQITIEYTTPAGGCQNTSTQVVNVTAQDDASFTSVDFCESSVNVISAVAVPSGTFVIQSQTGAATIDGATGVLSGFAAGDQITIEYTTPAGACQNTSTQVVNVIPSDDGSFTMTQTCDGGTAAVTGLAGGTFAFMNAPGDGAVIDGATGVVSNGTNGATYDVEYTTNGLCPVTTNQSVIALAADDATFTLSPTCDGAIATVSGAAGGIFSFDVPAIDGAVIDANSGDISGGDFNSTYSIMYTTAGACPASSVEQVTVDDCSVSADIVIPTAFTPGTDGINGTWEIQDLDNIYPENRVVIYNRWGSVVYEYMSSAAAPYSLNKWDGTFKGQPLPVASYYYIIDGNDGSGDTFKGTVTIVKN